MVRKNIVICDRFVDSTTAYQVYGKGVKKNFINFIHKYILSGLKPDITFLLTVDIKSSLKRLNKRKKKNRYDKFSKSFYIKVQKAFINIAKKNKGRYFVLDNSQDTQDAHKQIIKKFLKVYNKWMK